MCDYCNKIFCVRLTVEQYSMLRRIHGASSESDPDLCPNPDTCKNKDDLSRSLDNRFARKNK